MKYVTVPAPITPKTLDGEDFMQLDETASRKKKEEVTKPVGETSMHRYLMTYVINEKEVVKNAAGKEEEVLKIGRGYAGNKLAAMLDNMFATALEGEVVGPIQDEDHKIVARIISERNWANSAFGKCFMSIEKAWMNASEEKPVKSLPAVEKIENGRELPPGMNFPAA